MPLKKYPVEVTAIDKNVINEWFESFNLPVAPEKFNQTWLALKEAYFSVIRRKQSSYGGKILAIDIKIFMEYSKILCSYNFIELLRKNGQEAVFSKNARFFGLAAGTTALEVDCPPAPVLKGLAKLKRKLRSFAYGVRINKKFLYALDAKDLQRDSIPVYNIQPLKESLWYSKKRGFDFMFASQEEWLNGHDRIKLDHARIKELEDSAAETCRCIRDAAQALAIDAPFKIYEYLEKFTFQRLLRTAKEYEAVHLNTLKKGPMHILGSNQCAAFNRMLALANRENGGFSTSFNHGNDAFSCRDLRMEMSFVNEFMTYSKAGAENLRVHHDKIYQPFIANSPEIRSLDLPLYKNIFEKYSAGGPVKKVKKIFVLGHAFDPNDALIWGHPDIGIFHLEMKIVRRLVADGFEVICKGHPDTFEHLPEDFYGPGTKVIYDRFEEVMQECDGMLFYLTISTTFPYGLCTNKPAVLLNTVPSHRIYPGEVLDMLKKRCAIFDVTTNSDNVYEFDGKAVSEYFRNFDGKIDTSLIEKYMF